MKSVKCFLIIFSLVTVSIWLLSCSDDKKDEVVQKSTFADSMIVAAVNGELITTLQVDEAARQLIAQAGLMGKVNYKDYKFRKQALDWLISNTLLRQEVKNHSIEIKEREIDAAIEQVKRNFSNDEMFLASLEQQSLSVDKLRENIAIDLKVQKLLQREILDKLHEIDTDEAKKYYADNQDKFTEPGKADARHVLIRIKREATEDEINKALEKAEMVLNKAKKGEDFATLAKDYSEGPNAYKGGDLGLFARGEMVKAFDDAVFKMKPGEISNIVRSELGFHIIKLEKYEDPQEVPFGKVEQEIKAFLKQQRSNDMFNQYVDNLKEDATIQISENF